MEKEQRKRLAAGLKRNKLLRVLLDERIDEIRFLWSETEPDAAETRERFYVELRATEELRDSIYAKLGEYCGDASNN